MSDLFMTLYDANGNVYILHLITFTFYIRLNRSTIATRLASRAVIELGLSPLTLISSMELEGSDTHQFFLIGPSLVF